MPPAQRESVRQRAGGRCEYCHLPDSALDSADFHVEHIVARKHGGFDNEGNLAWACISGECGVAEDDGNDYEWFSPAKRGIHPLTPQD